MFGDETIGVRTVADADRLHRVPACCMEFLAAHHIGVADGKGSDWRRLRLVGRGRASRLGLVLVVILWDYTIPRWSPEAVGRRGDATLGLEATLPLTTVEAVLAGISAGRNHFLPSPVTPRPEFGAKSRAATRPWLWASGGLKVTE